MNLEKYPVVSIDEHLVYEFLSEGPMGAIKKIIYFQQVNGNLFNLLFGDWKEEEQMIDDMARSNNNDRNKVIATVASTVFDFLKHYPEAVVFIKGSTHSRTRLYQIGILTNWHEISQLLIIEGFRNNNWEFIEKQRNYLAFLVRTK